MIRVFATPTLRLIRKGEKSDTFTDLAMALNEGWPRRYADMNSQDFLDRLRRLAEQRLRLRPGLYQRFYWDTVNHTIWYSAKCSSLLPAYVQAWPALGIDISKELDEKLLRMIDEWAAKNSPEVQISPLPPVLNDSPIGIDTFADVGNRTIESKGVKLSEDRANPKADIRKRKALICEYENRWKSIDSDLREASRNGLSSAKAAERTFWVVSKALDWAKKHGKYSDASSQGINKASWHP